MAGNDAGKPMKPATLCVHGGMVEKGAPQGLSSTLYQSSSFLFDDSGHGEAVIARGEPGYAYTRLGNPTTAALERQVAGLEGGAGAVAFASGTAAIAAAVLAHAKQGDNVVHTPRLYGGTFKLFYEWLPRFGIELRKPAPRDVNRPEAYVELMDARSAAVYLESPSNPTVSLQDIGAIAGAVRRKNTGAAVLVDNTFATPIFQNPLALGADVVIHSATKFMGGHGDLLAGLAVAKSEEALTFMRRSALRDLGAVLDPFAAWLLLRGLKTLHLRMERHAANAMALAEWLSAYPKVRTVHYPGLPSHPQHELAKRQMKGFGAMLAFEIRGGAAEARHVLDSCRLFAQTATLGDCRSIITHPASTTHSPLSAGERAEAGVTDGLIRLSVGLEDACDLKDDLESALAAAF
jgi:methionine-gamma-lyase